METNKSAEAPTKLKIGALVRDEKRRRVGRVMGFVGPYVQVRPRAGGCEWDVRPEDLQAIGDDEPLSDHAAEASQTGRCLGA